MHMFPHTPIFDPVEERRLRSGRPATRAEIYRRHVRVSDQNARFITHDAVTPEPMPTTTQAQAKPTMVSTIRRSLSNALSSAAERISPEAA